MRARKRGQTAAAPDPAIQQVEFCLQYCYYPMERGCCRRRQHEI